MRRPLALLLALVVGLATAAGCGGGNGSGGSSAADAKTAYNKQLEAATAELQRTFGDISDQTGSGTSDAQIGDRLVRGASAIDASAGTFARIRPPAAAASAQAMLVAGLHEIAAQFRTAAAAAKAKDARALAASLRGLLTGDGSKRIAQATAALKAQGFGADATSTTSTTATTSPSS